ncbi:MAG: hypothetical protein VX871_03440 [Pseudomonadota bacterium]|nr:hypothetical protein [Pseudomonadota bacterium]
MTPEFNTSQQLQWTRIGTVMALCKVVSQGVATHRRDDGST